MKRALGALLALLVGGVLAEVGVRLLGGDRFGSLTLLPYDVMEPVRAGTHVDPASSYLIFDSGLGWQVGPDRHGRNGLYNSNSVGERVSPASDAPEPWATAFGDSFTHGDDVRDGETWLAQLGERGLPVVNAAVPGYGVDQAWLRYRARKASVRSRVILIGVMADNIARHLNRYRPFITPVERIYFVKPRFENGPGGLTLIGSPFKSPEDYTRPDGEVAATLFGVGATDRFFDSKLYEERWSDRSRIARIVRTLASRPNQHADWRTLYADPTAVELTLAVVKGFADEVRLDQRTPVIVFLPERSVTDDVLQGQTPRTQTLVAGLRSLGASFVDLTAPVADFVREGKGSLNESFLPHYSPALSSAVADAVSQWKKTEKSLP